MSWHAVRTEPCAEWLAEGQLRRRGVDVLLPHWRTTASHARRVVPVKRPVFGRYLFAKIEPAESGRPGPCAWTVRSAPGVVGVLSQPIREDEMGQLRGRVDAAGAMLDVGIPGEDAEDIPVGSHVEFAAGPFVGMRGVVVGVRGAVMHVSGGGVAIPRTLHILVDALGGTINVSAPVNMVAKVSSP